MGGKKTTVPPPQPISAEEKALLKRQTEILEMQTNILQKNFRQQDLLAPLLFEEYGVTPQFDDEGEIIGFERDPEAEALKDRQQEIESLGLDRLEKALRGELPVDPAVSQQLEDAESQLMESIRRELGPGGEFSTPGSQRIREFEKSKAAILEGSRRGELSLAEGLTQGRELSRLRSQSNNMQGLFGINQGGLPFAQGFSSINAGYGSIGDVYSRQRDLNFQRGLTQAQLQAQNTGALFGGLGNIFGTIGGVAVGKYL